MSVDICNEFDRHKLSFGHCGTHGMAGGLFLWRVSEGRAANIRMLSGFALLADGEEFAGPKCNGLDGWLFCAGRGWALRWFWIYRVA